jgi:hypothetical protein
MEEGGRVRVRGRLALWVPKDRPSFKKAQSDQISLFEAADEKRIEKD